MRFNALQQKCQCQKVHDREVVTHMLTLMIRGLTFYLNLPIAQFATSGRNLLPCKYVTLHVY